MIEKTGSYTYIQEILENLQGNYEAETIASMAVSLDVKKELEAKLYPNFAERWIWMSVKTSAEKIPSEMEVAPPHKRFTQFSALIKL